MKSRPTLVERILFFVLVFVLLVIAAVSVWGLLFRRTDIGGQGSAGSVAAGLNGSPPALKMFTGIGRLRAPFKAGSVVVSPVFPYDSADRAFAEELTVHLRDFRTITLKRFADLTREAPELSDEALLKRNLLDGYNSLLHLGQIRELYFTDFMILD